MLQKELDRESSNSKRQGKKCEKYLSQLQRSADIIESQRSKHSLEIDNYENRLQNISNILEDQKEKNYDLEGLNQKLSLEIFEAKNIGENEKCGRYELKVQIDDYCKKREYQENDLSVKNSIIESKDNEIGRLNDEINNLRDVIEKDREGLCQIEEDQKVKDLEYEKLKVSENGYKSRVSQLEDRVGVQHNEYAELKNEKNKVGWSLGEKVRENDDLKNEIFMMKKLIVDIERRDLEINNLKNSRLNDQRKRDRDIQARDFSKNRENCDQDYSLKVTSNIPVRLHNKNQEQTKNFEEKNCYMCVEQCTTPLKANQNCMNTTPGNIQTPNNHKHQWNNHTNQRMACHNTKISKQTHCQGNTNIITWNAQTPSSYQASKKNMTPVKSFQDSENDFETPTGESYIPSPAKCKYPYHSDSHFDENEYQDKLSETVPKKGQGNRVSFDRYACGMTGNEMRRKKQNEDLLGLQLERDRVIFLR